MNRSYSKRCFRVVIVCLSIVLAFPFTSLRAAEQWIDLDGDPTNGPESRVVTRVLQAYPVEVENVVYNNSGLRAYRFTWAGAGPGGFNSYVVEGPDVGTKWEWSTISQVYSIQSPVSFKEANGRS